MRYLQLTPSPSMRRWVDCFWYLEDDGSGIQRIVPDGYPELILNLGRPFESFHLGCWRIQPRCFFAGQITGPLRIRPTGLARILAARFVPNGASAVFRMPVDELTGMILPLSDLSPVLSREIERVAEQRSIAARVTCFEQALERNAIQPDSLISSAVSQLHGLEDVGEVANRLGVCIRHLQRRFRAEVGISPKLFSRIQRFQGVFHAIEGGRSWVDAAVQCGYYDQAHLIRDFREFAGEPPVELLAESELASHFLRCHPAPGLVSRLSNPSAR